MAVQSTTSWVEINVDALAHNVRVLRRQAAPADVAAVVKADAYGHGAVDVARAALQAGAASLCVFTIQEAIELRQADIDAQILCLGPLLEGDASLAAGNDIAVVICSTTQANEAANAARRHGQRLRVQINVDSGMQRYGIAHQDAVELAATIRSHSSLELEGIFTHFPDAVNPNRAATLEAVNRFARTAGQINAPLRHASASAATFSIPEGAFDFVRAGIALYGIDPAPDFETAESELLDPVLSWRAALLSVREVACGETISYGGLWSAPRDSRIGVIGAGYADGLRRALSPGANLLVQGQRAPIRGAICMDSAMIDLTEIPEATVGDVVTIIGRDADERLAAWDLAKQLDTIPYEICTSIAARVPRRLVGNSIRS